MTNQEYWDARLKELNKYIVLNKDLANLRKDSSLAHYIAKNIKKERQNASN